MRRVPDLPAAAAGTRALGRGLEVGRIGLGAMHLVNVASAREARTLVEQALDLGVTLIDTADVYGPEAGERCIAEALHPYPERAVIATKGGFVQDGRGNAVANGTPDHLRRACDASLKRLRVDTIDLYQLHVVDPGVPLEESVGALADLRSEGKIRELGVSNVSAQEAERAIAVAPVISVQNRYNLRRRMRRGPDPALAVCERMDVTFIAYQPLAAGALGFPREGSAHVARTHGATIAQVALAWLLHVSRVIVPIPGTVSRAHLEENVGAASLRLTEDELRILEASS